MSTGFVTHIAECIITAVIKNKYFTSTCKFETHIAEFIISALGSYIFMRVCC